MAVPASSLFCHKLYCQEGESVQFFNCLTNKEMKNIIIAIIMFAICVALVIGTVLPVSELISDTGGEVYDTVKLLNDNITVN